MDLVIRVLGRREIPEMNGVFSYDGVLNMTYLALNLSHYVNGVAKKHGEVSRAIFGHYVIDAITNGVHAPTWTGEPFAALFDWHIPGWRQDNFSLRYALSIPEGGNLDGACAGEKGLMDFAIVRQVRVSTEHATLVFARRATAYKRADLIFTDLERLRLIAKNAGAFQVIFAGKAHPRDTDGKNDIRRIFECQRALRDSVRVVYLEHYNIAMAKLLVAGADVWLNTPEPPGTELAVLEEFFSEEPLYIPVSSAASGSDAAIHSILVALGEREPSDVSPTPAPELEALEELVLELTDLKFQEQDGVGRASVRVRLVYEPAARGQREVTSVQS
jgi:hypothetical protein